ncbi:MAG: prenyltransferase/squalene oxidase repeat-containing protein [Fluviicola sp.]|nr:prenyltransferase/squalene oxidase repeat-containing protein [Fluviicola sp.]
MKKRTVFLLLLLMNLSLTVRGQITKNALIVSSEKASTFLKQAQTESGSINDSTNTLFSIWETILVADALLDQFPATDSTIQRAITWLQSLETEQGLVCHNVKCSRNYCIETSALYIRLLARLQSTDSLSLLQRLKTIEQLQEKNGSWKVGNPDVLDKTDFPSVTGFVLNLYSALHFNSSRKLDAELFLISSQLENGSWGQTWEYYNCPGYALWQCLPSIKKCPSGAITFEKAKAFILKSQLENGSWYVAENEQTNHVSAELQTAFMLSCLQEEADELSQKAFYKGISFLLSKQLSNGSWEGGFFPIPNERYKKREYLITTALTLKLMIAAQNTFRDE